MITFVFLKRDPAACLCVIQYAALNQRCCVAMIVPVVVSSSKKEKNTSGEQL